MAGNKIYLKRVGDKVVYDDYISAGKAWSEHMER